MPRHFTDIEKESIRNELIQVGLELFERYGVDKTSIGDITNKARIGKGTFYLFFSSKGDLFMEVYRQEREKVTVDLFNKYKDREGEVSVILKDYIYEMLAILKTRPILDVAYESYTLGIISDKSVQKRLLEYNRISNKELAELIKHWFRKREMSTLDPEIIVGMIRSMTFLKFHKTAIGEDVFEEVIDSFIEGIVKLITT